MTNADIGGSQESAYEYSTSQVIDFREIISVTSAVDERVKKIRIFECSMGTVADNLGSCYTARFGATSKSKVKLNCFLVLASYCCDITDGREVDVIQYGLSMRRPGLRY